MHSTLRRTTVRAMNSPPAPPHQYSTTSSRIEYHGPPLRLLRLGRSIRPRGADIERFFAELFSVREAHRPAPGAWTNTMKHIDGTEDAHAKALAEFEPQFLQLFRAHAYDSRGFGGGALRCSAPGSCCSQGNEAHPPPPRSHAPRKLRPSRRAQLPRPRPSPGSSHDGDVDVPESRLDERESADSAPAPPKEMRFDERVDVIIGPIHVEPNPLELATTLVAALNDDSETANLDAVIGIEEPAAVIDPTVPATTTTLSSGVPTDLRVEGAESNAGALKKASWTAGYDIRVKAAVTQNTSEEWSDVPPMLIAEGEGHGSATIHDVTLLDIPKPPVPSTLDILDELLNEKELADKALKQVKKGKISLETYFATLNVQHAPISTFDEVLSYYDSRGKLDTKILSVATTQGLIPSNRCRAHKAFRAPRNQKLDIRTSLRVFAAEEGEVTIVLVYTVGSAARTAAYDIRVDLQMREKPVTLIYKAGIMQDTDKVRSSFSHPPIRPVADISTSPGTTSPSLETASPIFGVGMPTLAPLRVNVYHPDRYKKMKPFDSSARAMPGMAIASSALPGSVEEYAGERSSRISEWEAMPIEHRRLDVTSKGGVTTTFKVPRAIIVPSDGMRHNVTETRLELDARMSRVTVPQVDTKAHLKVHDLLLLQIVVSSSINLLELSKRDVRLVIVCEFS
ncbi:hypothetical protein DXG01_009094 [Tephrocybe rancida]|nr:hypothetical protein DXG01_009094 [Tephrocybe rancida]